MDPDGDVELYGLEIAFYAFFHNIVLHDVANENNLECEFVTEDKKFRIDLLGKDGSVYEVKPEPLSKFSSIFNRYHKQTGHYIGINGRHRGVAASLKLPEYDPITIGNCTITVTVRPYMELILYKVDVNYKNYQPSTVVVPRDTKIPVKKYSKKPEAVFALGLCFTSAVILFTGLFSSGGSRGNYIINLAP